MYQQMTTGAQESMRRANAEAIRLCHQYIGTEHILLSLTYDPHAVCIFAHFGIAPDRIRQEVEKIIQPGPDTQEGKLPCTPRAKKVLEFALSASRKLAHNYVGTEHMIAGQLEEKEGVGAQVLLGLGLSLDALMTLLRSGQFVAEHLAPVLFIQDGVMLIRAIGSATDKETFLTIVTAQLALHDITSVQITFNPKKD